VTTLRELAARVGRVALWLLMIVLLVRGAAGLVGGDGQTAVRGQARVAAPWPDDAARAFAVRFVSAYLERSARDPEADARAITGFVSPELAGELPARWEQPAPRQTVRSAVVSGAVAVDARRALVTVAATVAAARVSTRLVTVPVARDAGGGLVVYDLPSLAPAPSLATVGRELGEPLLGSEGAEVRDVLTRFLRAYLAGDAGGLTYLVPPGTRIGASTGGFELVELGSVAAVGTRGSASRLLVLATVQARDVESRAVYALRFRVRLLRRDRWYVAGLDGSAAESRRP
jgi:Conjugative transposon protein TcpC